MKTNIFKVSAILIGIFMFISSCDEVIEPDTTPPSVVILNPINQTTVSGDVTVSVNATDNETVSSVEIQINGQIVTTLSEEPYEYEWITAEYSEDENHSISATATDDSENSTQTQPISVFVDNQDNVAPTGIITAPVSGQTVLGTVEILVEATDNDTIQSVEFSIDGNLVNTDTESPYAYAWDTTTETEDQDHIIGVTVNDVSGNSTTVQPISVFVNNEGEPEDPDETPPTAVITNPAAGQTVSETVNIQVTASDNVGVASVEFSIDGNLVNTDTESPYAYAWDTTTETEDQDHIIGVTVNDVSGNSTTVQPISVFVNNEEDIVPDTQTPTVILQNPVNGQTVSGEISVTISASDNIAVSEVNLYIDNSLVSTFTNAPYSYSWNTINETEDELHSLYATASDDAGNSASTEPISVTVDNEPNIPEAPNFISVTTDGESIIVGWSSVYQTDYYRLYRDGSYFIQTTELSFTDTGLTPDVEYCYSVTAVVDGNESPQSDTACATAVKEPLDYPNDLTASGGLQSVFVNWSEVNEAVSYNVYLSGSSRDLELLGNITDSYYNHTGLDHDTEYCYVVACVDSDGDEGIQSPDVCATTDTEPAPYPPTNINVAMDGENISLTWTASASNNVNSYSIFKNGSYHTSVDSSVTQYLDNDYSYNEEICYYLKAVTVSGVESEQSQEACLTTSDNPNIFDVKIVSGDIYSRTLNIYQNSTSNEDLIYSTTLSANDIIIELDLLPQGDNYIARYDDWPVAVFSVNNNILVTLNNNYAAPVISEWNP